MTNSGQEKFTAKLEGAGKAFVGLDAEIGGIGYDFFDSVSVQVAIARMEQAIDARVAKYPGNLIVKVTANALKGQYRQMILDHLQK